MALAERRGAHEKEQVHGRADGRDPAGADRGTMSEVARKHKVSEQTLYGWRKKYGELEPTDVKRLRQLEAENAKLKRMVAEREMAIDTLKEINRKKW
jgi:transposase-like protein